MARNTPPLRTLSLSINRLASSGLLLPLSTVVVSRRYIMIRILVNFQSFYLPVSRIVPNRMSNSRQLPDSWTTTFSLLCSPFGLLRHKKLIQALSWFRRLNPFDGSVCSFSLSLHPHVSASSITLPSWKQPLDLTLSVEPPVAVWLLGLLWLLLQCILQRQCLLPVLLAHRQFWRLRRVLGEWVFLHLLQFPLRHKLQAHSRRDRHLRPPQGLWQEAVSVSFDSWRQYSINGTLLVVTLPRL